MRWTTLFLVAGLAAFADDAEDQRAKEAIEAFKGGYAAKLETDRVKAVEPLGQFPHPSVIKVLATLLTSDGDRVRAAAAQALGKFPGRKDVAPALAAALKPNEDHPDVVAAILAALGGTGDPAAAKPLADFLDDNIAKREKEDLAGEIAAVGALKQLHTKTALEALIDSHKKNQVVGGTKGKGNKGERKGKEQLAKELKKALREVTGQQLDGWQEWRDWWEDNAARFDEQINPK